MNKDKVFITGGTGFIGSHILRQFCRNNIRPGCLVRRKSNIANIENLNVSLLYGDIRDQQSLVNAFAGYSFVIHNAAFVSDWGEYERFYTTNVDGTLNVLRASVLNNIKDIIITGSISIYGEEDSIMIKDESFPFNSHYNYFLDTLFPCKLNYYRDTKAVATREAILFAKKEGLNLTILEPVWVYGEREFHTGFFEYLKAAKSGLPFAPGSKENKFHVIYAEDLAMAYFLAFKKKLKGIHRIILGNEKPELMDNIYSLFCKEAHVKKPKNIPKFFAYPAGFIMELAYTLFGAKKPPLLSRGRVNMFYDNIEYATHRARELLGFKNSYSLEAGIKKTVAWYRENKLI